jgi:hypothetical protein
VDILDLPTPSLLVERGAFDRNVETMAARWPGTRLRPHVKAFKSTALAKRLAANGHTGFCCATLPAEDPLSQGTDRQIPRSGSAYGIGIVRRDADPHSQVPPNARRHRSSEVPSNAGSRSLAAKCSRRVERYATLRR